MSFFPYVLVEIETRFVLECPLYCSIRDGSPLIITKISLMHHVGNLNFLPQVLTLNLLTIHCNHIPQSCHSLPTP